MANGYIDVSPKIDPTAFIASSADIIGAVTISKDASIWYQVVIRADDEPITVGVGSNIQDGTIVHIDIGYPTVIGNHVTIGHRAIVHGAVIADDVMISMGAMVLSGARIGKNAIVGAGALVTEGMEVPENALVLGVPGRIVKEVTQEQIDRIRQTTEGYVKRGRLYRDRLRAKDPTITHE